MRKYIGDRAFYKMAFTVAIPIMLQNLITNLVNMLDNIMVGQLENATEAMSGVSIANQLVFVFNLCIFGGLSGIGIFTAQFHGKDDNEGIRYTLRMKLLIAFFVSVVSVTLFLTIPEKLINLFIHDVDNTADIPLIIDLALDYIKIIIIGLPAFAIAQVFASSLRETGNTFTPMLAGLAAVIVNCVFNYLLIFGKFGFPMLGLRGAAIATVMSRYVELGILLVYVAVKRNTYSYVKGLFRGYYIPRRLFVDMIKKGTPLLLNEFLWSAGMTCLSIAYSLYGPDILPAYSISSTVSNLSNVAFLSLGSSIGIISGKLLGAGKHEEAIDAVRKLIALSLAMSVCLGVLLYFIGENITSVYNCSDKSKDYATFFIKTCACAMPIISFANASYFTLRSGGKTIITFLFDSGELWLISVPLAFGLYYLGANPMPIYITFPAIQFVEIIKVTVGLILVRKRVWVNTMV